VLRMQYLIRSYGQLKQTVYNFLPFSIRRALIQQRGRVYDPPQGQVRFGDFRRVTPISPKFGLDRGKAVDRYYIENFLAQQAAHIKGRVLEIGDNAYTCRFGGAKVTKSDILHVTDGHPQATIIGDLATADHIPSDSFDCIILTQTLHLIYDVRAALATLYRILKPGGVLLVTVPGISQIDEEEWGHTWYWAFTARAVQKLFEEMFPADRVSIKAHGNVLAAVAFLHGLTAEELRQEELDYQDPYYQVSIVVKAVKPL
jgi:hypothetical protein